MRPQTQQQQSTGLDEGFEDFDAPSNQGSAGLDWRGSQSPAGDANQPVNFQKNIKFILCANLLFFSSFLVAVCSSWFYWSCFRNNKGSYTISWRGISRSWSSFPISPYWRFCTSSVIGSGWWTKR